MKITSVDIWTVVVPTIPGRVHSPECVPETGWDQMSKHIVRLNTDTELTGLGETGRGEAIEQVREGAAWLLGKDPEQLTCRIFSPPATTALRSCRQWGVGRRMVPLRWRSLTWWAKLAKCRYTRCWAVRYATECGPITGWGT